MAELKTRKTTASVAEFLRKIPDPEQRADAATIARLMKAATGARPKMWGEGIVGFGDYHYRYASGREGDWFLAGFAPRKGNLTLYLGFAVDRHRALLKKLGKHTTGKGCLYIKKLEDVDGKVLRDLIRASVREMRRTEVK
jgi:hypothetical protein